MLKWKLLITTVPYVVLVVSLAWVRDFVLHVDGLIEFSEVSPILSVVSLIIGFMLAGVLADFKESEKIPGEIATTLETIGDTVEIVLGTLHETDPNELRQKYNALVSTVDDWLLDRVAVEKCYVALSEFRDVIKTIQSTIGAGYAIRCLAETHNLRRTITRVDVIERTEFIPVGYALLDLLVGSVLILLLAANYKTLVSEYLLITLFSLIYIYMSRLIRDLDAPFAYSSDKGAAEVNPYPLQEYRRRLEEKRD